MTPLAAGLQALARLVKRNRDVLKALQKMETSLKQKANVAGYGVGTKKVKGRRAEQVAAVFYVLRKVPLAKLKPKDRLPKTILVRGKRVPTDVVVLKGLKALGSNAENIKRQRPMNSGAQIEAMVAFQDVEISPDGYGTAGAAVKERTTGDKFMLTCAHVLHAEGNDLIQPSKKNGQGNSTKAERQQGIFKDNTGSVRKLAGSGVDAGYVETAATTNVIGIGPYGSVQDALPGLPVMKSGATTGVTEGTIDADDAKFFQNLANVLVNSHPEIFKGQPAKNYPSLAGLFLIKPATFGDGGDSGSLVVVGPEKALSDWVDNNAEMKKLKKDARDALKRAMLYSAVGLLCYAGTAGAALKYQGFVGQKLQVALDALNVDLIT